MLWTFSLAAVSLQRSSLSAWRLNLFFRKIIIRYDLACTPFRRWYHPGIPPPGRGFAWAQGSANGNKKLSQIVALASVPFLRLLRRSRIGISSVSSPQLQSRFPGHLVPQTPSLAW